MKMIAKMLAFVGVFILVLILTGAQGLAVNVPPFVGINYGPYHKVGQSPDIGTRIPDSQFLADLTLIYQKKFRYIRTYAVDTKSGLDKLVPLINVNRDIFPDLKVYIGVYESSQYRGETEAELATAIQLANSYPGIVKGVVVGNEWSDKDFAPGPVTVAQIRADLQHVRSSIPNPDIVVTTCFGFNAALNPEKDQFGRTSPAHYAGPSYGTQLKDNVDAMMFTSYPFFAGYDVSIAYDDSKYWYDYAVGLFSGKQVFMGELGWPSQGPNQPLQNTAAPQPPNPAVPSIPNEKTYVTALLNNQQNPDPLGPVFVFEAFDEPWKKGDPREPYWGLWTSGNNPVPKFEFTVPLFPRVAIFNKQWIGPNPNNLWSNPDNWDPAGVPVAGDDVLLTIDTGSQSVLYDVNSNAPQLNSLAIDATGGGTMTLQQFGNDLSTGGEVVGRGGQGIHNQFGGSNMVNGYLILGRDADSRGTYNLYNNASLSVTVAEIIGNSGTGNFNHYGGSHTVDDILVIGAQVNGSGNYQLYNGHLEVAAETIGDANGTGSFRQLGGTHAVNGNLILGLLNGSGTYQLLNGSLSAEDESIGEGGNGAFSQLGGSHLVADTLTLGSEAGSGTYELLSGNLQADREIIGSAGAGGPGSGSFTQTAGTNSAAGLWLGYEPGSTGTYTLNSGQLSAQTEFVGVKGSGTFTQKNGTNTMTMGLMLGAFAGSSGTYNLEGGSLSTQNEIIGNAGTGTFNHTYGNHTVNGNLSLGNSIDGIGTYNLQGGTLQAVNESIGTGGGGSDSFLNQSGGLNTVTDTLEVGDAVLPSFSAYNLSGGILTAKNIAINEFASFNVMNVVTTVTGDMSTMGNVRTTNATVTWNGKFTNGGAYISDHAKQNFNKDLEVGQSDFGPDGYLVGITSQDLFTLKENFINNSTNNTQWNTVQATLKFATNADTSHDFFIAGADNGPPGHVPVTAVTDNFAWGTLDIAGQTVHLFDGNDTPGGAQYVGALIGADVAGIAVNNIVSDPDSLLNIYYDPDLALNFYLGGLTYDLAGGNGQLIPFHTPLPPSVLLLGSGLLGLGLLGWRRKRSG